MTQIFENAFGEQTVGTIEEVVDFCSTHNLVWYTLNPPIKFQLNMNYQNRRGVLKRK